MSFDLPWKEIFPVRELELRLDPAPHPFELANRDAIARNWAHEIAAQPALFDGQLALLSALDYRDGRLVGHSHMVAYSTFLLWRRLRPVADAGHCFAHPMLVASDGSLIAARMGAHTANPGRVYFAAGSFDPADFGADGRADLERNMVREVCEETGVDLAGLSREEGYHAYTTEIGTVIFRRYFLDADAATVAARIDAFVAGETEPEIEGPVVIASADDRPDGLMPHMVEMMKWHFGAPASAPGGG